MNPFQPLKIKVLMLCSFSLFVAACSKDPSGVYVSDEGSFYRAEIDLRSDGSAETEMTSDLGKSATKPAGQLIGGLLAAQMSDRGTIPDGKWARRDNLITVEGKSPNGEDNQLTFRIEPNGDLIAVKPSTALIIDDRFTKQ